MARHPQRHGVEPCKRQIGDAGGGPLRQHQGEWPRPERGGEALRIAVENGKPPRRGRVGDVGNQRVEARPALGGVEPRHRLAIAGGGAEPIDRLGGEGDKPAGRQTADRRSYCLRVGLHYPRCRLCGHAFVQACGLVVAGVISRPLVGV
jgi:hypothetical protein